MTAPAATPPPRFRALIADDEPAARRGVRLLLEQDPDCLVAGEAAGGAQAVAAITRARPDLVFLDVQMPELDGFEVIERVGAAHMPAVVFVTAYDEHALRAFEVSAVDYLLKPFTDERFHAALARAKAAAARRRRDEFDGRLSRLIDHLEVEQRGYALRPGGDSPYADRVLLKSGGEIFFLKTGEIDWIEAEGDYMKFHAAGKTHLLRETMARLEQRLDPRLFVRIHRSTIVNFDRVRRLSPAFAGEYAVMLHDGTKLRLSRGYHARLQAMLANAL